jgi:RimJ/RimL family protein N-acetyltransferase
MAEILPRNHDLPNGHTLTIRSVQPDDAAAVLNYAEQISTETSFLSFGPGEFGFTEERERERLCEFRDTANQLALVGIVDGAFAAMLTFGSRARPRNQHTGEFGLSVRQSLWGQGVGGLLLDTLIEWAKTSGVVTKINLRVRTDNPRAIALYQRKGFVVEGTVSRDLRIDGVYYDHHLMGLAL